MENLNEIIINDTNVIKQKKFKKPLTDEQKAKQKEAMKRFYEKKKSDPEYIERQRLSSRTHYYNHKELQQDSQADLHTGKITQEDYNKFQQMINNILAHLHLTT
jgi:hypothetical protein